MSTIRKQILDAFITACSGIDGVGLVQQELTAWEELKPKDLPAVFCIDADATIEREAYSEPRFTCEMQVDCWGITYARGSADLATARTEHIKDIVLAVRNSTELAALINDVHEREITTDRGTVPRYSVFVVTFTVMYDYNSDSP